MNLKIPAAIRLLNTIPAVRRSHDLVAMLSNSQSSSGVNNDETLSVRP